MNDVVEKLTHCEVILYLLSCLGECPSELNPAYIALAAGYALEDCLYALAQYNYKA